MQLRKITLILFGALALFTPGARAMSGTSQVASLGKPVAAVTGWPEGVLDLVNDPLRTDGWNPWFSQMANDVNLYEFKVRDTDDVNRLIQKLMAIKAPKVQVQLNPGSEATYLGYTTVLEKGNGAAVVFSLGNQQVLNAWYQRRKGKLELKEAPTAEPPTLILYAGNAAIDLARLKIPPAAEVSQNDLRARGDDAPDSAVVKGIENFIANRQSYSGKNTSSPTEPKETGKPDTQKLAAKKILGLVTDEAAKPLAKVRWQISAREAWQDGQWVRILLSGQEPEFYTDNEGRFELPVSDEARCDLLFDREDRGPTFVFQVGSDRRELHVVMKPGIPVRATAIRADNQEPIRDQTRVSLTLPNPRGLWYRTTQQVDHNGQVHFYASPAPTLPDEDATSSPRWQIECAGQSIPIDVREGEPVNVRVKVAVSAYKSEFSSRQSAAKTERAAELKFLSDVPEFREFNLKMTEERLKELIKEHHLLADLFSDEDGKTSYRVFRNDGENVIISFRGGVCGAVQRMRRDAEGLAKLRESKLVEGAGKMN